jgi:hypothetical protein
MFMVLQKESTIPSTPYVHGWGEHGDVKLFKAVAHIDYCGETKHKNWVENAMT